MSWCAGDVEVWLDAVEVVFMFRSLEVVFELSMCA